MNILNNANIMLILKWSVIIGSIGLGFVVFFHVSTLNTFQNESVVLEDNLDSLHKTLESLKQKETEMNDIIELIEKRIILRTLIQDSVGASIGTKRKQVFRIGLKDFPLDDQLISAFIGQPFFEYKYKLSADSSFLASIDSFFKYEVFMVNVKEPKSRPQYVSSIVLEFPKDSISGITLRSVYANKMLCSVSIDDTLYIKKKIIRKRNPRLTIPVNKEISKINITVLDKFKGSYLIHQRTGEKMGRIRLDQGQVKEQYRFGLYFARWTFPNTIPEARYDKNAVKADLWVKLDYGGLDP
ncbi:MAG: hypothetical protein MRZ79_19965 [Bacteroidia bacterium]|nr:hypothetical protein [Bacteroidia bacterium]